MENREKIIQDLVTRIEQLTRQQKVFQDEIQKLHQDLQKFRNAEGDTVVNPGVPERKVEQFLSAQTVPAPPQRVYSQPPKTKAPWEEFIGTNLLNKVGIAVLVLGIGFGAKYSIDHKLLDHFTRMILGYLAGITLIGIAYRLKEKHPGFSAVLLSGGMAVLYFITYAAHSYFGLIPQLPAFALMVLFTVFTVFASVRYNLEIIGIIGLVGAYAVPVLLRDDSGRVLILFSYICIINSGIMYLAFVKYWKRLYYLSFILTWFIFGSWYAFSFDSDTQASISLIFSTLFFLIFYTTFIAYKLIRKESLGRWDVVCMLVNTFLYFGYGYLTIETLANGSQYLGLFSVLNALMHFVAGVIIYRNQDSVSDSFYFVAGMVLVFLTIAVPIQLEGSWVTLVWSGEAVLLFWIGRTKAFSTYEKLSYPLVGLAFISLLHDWSNYYPAFYDYSYDPESDFRIFLNIQFLTSMLVGATMVFILWIAFKNPKLRTFAVESGVNSLITVGVPLLTLVVFYGGFFKEIEAFWNSQYGASKIVIPGSEGKAYDQYNRSLLNFKGIWLIIYSAIFASLLCLLQLKLRTHLLASVCLVVNTVVLFIFITAGLWDLSALRSAFLDQDLADYYQRGYGHVLIRYIAVVAMLPLLWFNWKLSREEFFSDTTGKAENLSFHFAVLVLLSSELIHWLDMARVEDSFKLSLSILWGAYALFLIVVGLSRDQKHIRLGAIVLFAATLLKLFAYDMADMSTISKTVVMIVLGALLLTASFVYNKYRRTGSQTP